MNFNFKEIFNIDSLLARWKTFAVSFGAAFLMAVLPHLGVTLPSLISPASSIHDPFDGIRAKLEVIPLSFKLKNPTNFIPQAQAAGDYDQAKSYIVVDLNSGQVLAQKDDNEQAAIASITKLMTAIVSLDLAQPSDLFTVSQTASEIQPTKIGVVPGQKMSLEELLNAALMTSANDAAQVVKEGVNTEYTSDIFVKAMNAKAQVLGLKNTHFSNPQGFDIPGNYSSAADLAILAQYALQNYPVISDIVKKDYQFLPANNNHKQYDLYNWNGLLDVYPGTFGVKIGNTDQAGYTTIVASKRGGKTILAVLLGAPGVMERDLWAAELLDIGFKQEGVDPVNVTKDQLQAKYATWKYWN